MAFEVPPGLRLLPPLLSYLLLPPLFAFTFLQLYSRSFFGPAVDIPNHVSIACIILSRPCLTIFQRYFKRYIDSLNARKKNAFVIPSVKEKRPNFGGISLIRVMIDDFERGYVGEVYKDWGEQYGNIFQLRLPTNNRIFTFEPDHIKALLATQFDNFVKGPIFVDQLQSLLGTGVFNSDGGMWKFHRSITRPFFSRERVSDFELFDVHADKTLRLARDRLEEGEAIDFQDLVARFTLDSATEFLFGHNVDSLSASLPYASSSAHFRAVDNHPSNAFVDAFMDGQLQSSRRLRLGPGWPMGELFKDLVKTHRKVVDKFVDPILKTALHEQQQKKSKINTQGEEERETETLLQYLIDQTQDINVLRDEILNLLVAGRDTTACTLTFAVYMLSEHPDIAEKLRQEVFDKVGPTNRPTYDDMREMKYLRAFISEVLRLYPPVPFNIRESVNATVLTSKTPGSKPYYVPPKTGMVYSVLHMQRRKDLWGPDALEFDPSRFIDSRLNTYLTPNPYIFCPFNAGPRICLGQQFAYHEASFFLVRLLQQFTNFRLAPDAQPEESKPPKGWKECKGRKGIEKIMPGIHLTMYVQGGLWIRMDEVGSE